MIGKRILNYQVISLLGEGGMGNVYKAYDLQLERYVAIKVINQKYVRDPLFIERFRVEAKNQAKLNHPNIVTVYGFIETKEATGIVMEYVDGSTISQLISSYGRLDLIFSLRVLQQVLVAVEYAHSMGFIHRDLKPSNIIIDRNGMVKIMDFGISKSLNENHDLTRVGINIGTPHYMSPEQIKNLELTSQTDIYSLGITLYEMLSGSPPFNFNSVYEIYDAHLKLIPEKLSESFPDIPEEVDKLILRALNKSTQMNFINAYEFRSSIEQLIFNLPLLLEKSTSSHTPTNSVSGEKTRSANLIVSIIVIVILSVIGVSYLLIDKFIIKERLNTLEDNKTKISYLTTEKFFSAPWEIIEPNVKAKLNTISSTDSRLFIAGTSGSLLLSENVGQSWKRINFNDKFDFNSSLPLADELLFVASDGRIFQINNSGKVVKSYKLTDENLLAIRSKENIYICGSGGTIFKSKKDSFNFQQIPSPTKQNLYDIFEIGNSAFITCGWDGTIYKTTNDGVNFEKEKLSQTYLKKLYFINQFLGFVGGADGNLFKTTDGGENWSKVNINTVATINDIIFVNQKTGYIVTSEGELFISENSGEDWLREKLGIKGSLNKISVMNNGLIFIVGDNGIILKNKI